MGKYNASTDTVWSTTHSGFTAHAFDSDGRALCNRGIRPRTYTTTHDGWATSDAYSQSEAFTLHPRCVQKLNAAKAPAEQAAPTAPHTYAIRAAATKTTGHYRRPGTMTTYCTGAPTDLHANTGKTRRTCTRCVKAEAADRTEAAAVVETHTPLAIATNAFEQGAYGLLADPTPGRYTLRVCEDSAVLCNRGQCRATSTRAAGSLDEVRAAATAFRHAWPADEHGNPVEDEQAPRSATAVTLEDLAATVACPECRATAGARCTTRAGKPARETHGRRFEAVEDAAGITQHRATERRNAEARGGWVVTLDSETETALLTTYADRLAARAVVEAEARLAAEMVTEAEANDGTWQGAWIGDPVDDTLFAIDHPTEQGALFA